MSERSSPQTQEHSPIAHVHKPGVDHGHRSASGLLAKLLGAHRHDSSDSIDATLTGPAAGIKAVTRSLAVLGLTAMLQLVVVLMSGSAALFADTIHNFADASTAVPLWLAFALSRKAATPRYTYGYGRAEDLAGVFVVLMIAASSVVAAFESIQKLLHPQPLDHLGWVAVAAVVGCLGNETVAQYRIRTGERIGSAALIADGHHARTDGLTSLGVLLGVAGVWLGFPQADPLVGLAITVAILLVLKSATAQIWHRLMDSVDPKIVEQAHAAAGSAEGVYAVSRIRARWIGHRIHADVLVTAHGDLNLRQAHAVAERARHAMLHAVPRLASVIVHVDPHSHDGQDHHADLAHHDQPVTQTQMR